MKYFDIEDLRSIASISCYNAIQQSLNSWLVGKDALLTLSASEIASQLVSLNPDKVINSVVFWPNKYMFSILEYLWNNVDHVLNTNTVRYHNNERRSNQDLVIVSLAYWQEPMDCVEADTGYVASSLTLVSNPLAVVVQQINMTFTIPQS